MHHGNHELTGTLAGLAAATAPLHAEGQDLDRLVKNFTGAITGCSRPTLAEMSQGTYNKLHPTKGTSVRRTKRKDAKAARKKNRK